MMDGQLCGDKYALNVLDGADVTSIRKYLKLIENLT